MSATVDEQSVAQRTLTVEAVRSQLQAGSTVRIARVPFLVRYARQETGQNSGAYLKCSLGDETGWIDAILWGAAKLSAQRVQSLLSAGVWMVEGLASINRYGGRESPQIKVEFASPVDVGEATTIPGLVKRSRSSEEELGEWLSSRIAEVRNVPLRQLLEATLGESGEWRTPYLRVPAGLSIHHSYIGGLADHVREMADTWLASCHLFPRVDRELTLAGILLHDVGKLDTFEADPPVRQSRSGKFVDHITAGVARLTPILDRYPDFPAGLRDHLLHIVISHHGQKEHGSPLVHATREAIVVHHLDRMTSLLDHFDQWTGGAFVDQEGWTTARSPWLDIRLATESPACSPEE